MSERFFTTSLLASSEKNFSHLALSPYMSLQKTVGHPLQTGPSTTVPLTESSRGKEGSLGRQQDLQDASPDPLFHPALIAAGHGRPGSEALGQFAPGRASMRDPEHTFHHQAMIDRRTPCRRLLWRQEWAHFLPVDGGVGGQPRHRDGSRQLVVHRSRPTREAQDMKAP